MSNQPESFGIQEPPTFLKAIAANWKRASASALLVSLMFHAAFLTIAMMLVVGGGGGAGDNGTGGGDPGPVEMAVVSEGELSEIQDRAIGMQTPSVPDAVSREVTVETNIPDAGPTGLAGGGDSIGDIGTMTGGGDISLGGGDGGLGLGGSGGGGASFFGVEARGNRFAYLVDISGSMIESLKDPREGTRLQALKAELARSTSGLLENSQFIIIQFSSDATPLTEKKEWIEASPSGKKRIQPLILNMTCGGGTNPLPGFEIIFNLKPRPDAIYFMTDGEFDPSTVEAVASLNQKLKIPIHCICLGSQAGTENMKKIAKGSKGAFTVIGGQP